MRASPRRRRRRRPRRWRLRRAERRLGMTECSRPVPSRSITATAYSAGDEVGDDLQPATPRTASCAADPSRRRARRAPSRSRPRDVLHERTLRAPAIDAGMGHDIAHRRTLAAGPTRSPSVPRSGLASIASTRSSRAAAMAIPSRTATVVLADATLRASVPARTRSPRRSAARCGPPAPGAPGPARSPSASRDRASPR